LTDLDEEPDDPKSAHCFGIGDIVPGKND